jgi:HlyD family secretion protein
VEQDKLTIATVRQDEFQEFIPVTGNVLPMKTVYLDAIEGGQVERKFLEEGAVVKAGDTLLKLSNTNLLLDIMQRESQLFEHINNLRNTRLAMEQNKLSLRSQLLELDYRLAQLKENFSRNKKLVEKDLISKEEFEKTKFEYEYLLKKRDLTLDTYHQDSLYRVAQIQQLENSAQRMQANLSVVKQKLDNLTLRAPVAGQLSTLNAEIGELKTSGMRLGQVDILEGSKVRAGIDEHYIARIFPGQMAQTTIDGKDFALVVKKVFPQVREGKFEVDMEFAGNLPQDIRRGQSLQIRLELGNQTKAVLVPRGGFYQRTGGNWIYVVDRSGDFATRRSIRLGRQNPENFEVMEGLQPGEKVITSSYEGYDDIDKIVLNN